MGTFDLLKVSLVYAFVVHRTATTGVWEDCVRWGQ